MIHLVFTDDWELRGNGSGDPETLQFQPMRKLVSIFNRHGLRASFFAEMMQQLTFRRLQGRYPELKVFADRWDTAVVDTYRQGHDIQLHLHPQWNGATFENGRWNLPGAWALFACAPAELTKMLSAAKAYLEQLLKGVDPNYKCTVFRAGAWCIAPSPFTLHALVNSGFRLDTSVAGGIRTVTRNISIDYRSVEERFAPYYPCMEDARRVSNRPEPIVCMPTHTLRGERFLLMKRDIKLVWRRIASRQGASGSKSDSPKTNPSADDWSDPRVHLVLRLVSKVVSRYVLGETIVADISHLDYPLLTRMLANIRKRVSQHGLKSTPVVLAGHTKDIRNFDDIERFVSDIARADDVSCITISELSRQLSNGSIPVRSATTQKQAA